MAVLSPAKRMAADSLFDRAMTRPVFEADAAHLAEELKSCPAWRLEPLLGVNPELAVQAFCAYQEFDRRGSFRRCCPTAGWPIGTWRRRR